MQWNDAPSQVLIEPEKLWRIRERSQPLIERTELNPLEKSDNDRTQIELNPLEITEHPPLKGEKGGKGGTGKRRGARGKQHQSGCLYPYFSNRKLKDGRIASYPRVEGQRDPDNIEHWYWAYCYEENVDGDWKNRSLPVPKFRVRTIREMIERNAPLEAIKAMVKGEFSDA